MQRSPLKGEDLHGGPTKGRVLSSLTGRVILAVLLAVTTSWLNAATVWAAQLARWTFNPNTRRLELVIPGGTTPQYFLLAQPPRIVVDLPNTQVGNVPELNTYTGVVRSVRVGQFQPELTRIVIELAPDVVFAPGHIDIQSPDHADSSNASAAETWYIRPLLVGDATPPPIPSPSAVEAGRSGDMVIPDTPGMAESEVDVNTADITANTANASATSANTTDAIDTNSVDSNGSEVAASALTDGLPPLEPGALEIPIELMEQATPGASPIAVGDTALGDGDRPLPSPNPVTDAVTLPDPAVSPDPVLVPEPNSQISTSEDLATAPEAAPPSPPSPPSSIENGNGESNNAPEIPIIEFGQDFQTGTPTSSDSSGASSELLAANGMSDRRQTTEPFSTNGATGTNTDIIVAANEAILIPAGTRLTLRYPRDVAFSLSGTTARQEVLVTAAVVRDRAGTVLVPAGSLIIGRFETKGRDGMRFIAQALALGDRTITMEESTTDLPETRSIQPNQLIQIEVGDNITR
ncbi:MAG: AMIN domain-containing protein [Cyanothece sp. SIO2G6]|nr:AMIN domain-containing protein [Cyanothece sp. SIO2G6]